MKRESHTIDRSLQVGSPAQRHLPLVDLLVDTRAELMELAVASGLKVLTAMLEEDRTAICGPRYQHQADRQSSRSLEPLPSTMATRGASKSAVSRRFVAKTAAQLDAWRSTALDALDLV